MVGVNTLKMAMLTELQKRRFEQLGPQWDQEDPVVVAKFVTAKPGVLWAAIAYMESEHFCYGYIAGLPDSPEGGEWGYFSLDELQYSRVLPDGDVVRPESGFHEAPLSMVLMESMAH